MAHTHPENSAEPSESDYTMFEMINNSLQSMRISVVDNIVLGEKDFYSSRTQRVLPYNEYADYNYINNRPSIPQDNG